ncbi:MAG TPA: acetolactate decarboxylase [Mucilaginibacter sp.]|nr:acetolactate decarboxylase [Mucilaginibacter sp.]
MKPITRYFLIALMLTVPFYRAEGQQNELYSAGYASAFIGGLYDAWYPYRDLHSHGNFGLGAPARLDGELIMLDGVLYKTQYTGKTTPIDNSGETPYAVVCFFKAKQLFKPGNTLTKAALLKYLDSVLASKNGLYAIHIKGHFRYLKTRAFPPVTQKPYLPLASMLDRQHFFEFNDIDGDLVGYRLPEFMEGPHISGYHFHFLSDDKQSGGHLIDVIAENIVIEIDQLDSYTMQLPQTDDFKNFDFKKDRKDEIKSVENGKK